MLDLLALQRSLGNRAVTRFLGRRPGIPPLGGLVQRCGATPCDCTPEERDSKEASLQRSWWEDAAEQAGQLGSELWNAAADTAQSGVDAGAGLIADAAEGAAGLLGGWDDDTGPSPEGGTAGAGGSGGPTDHPPSLPMLKAGAAGAAVTALQERLGALGFVTPVTGVFDAVTAAAVAAFQTTAGLVADGIVGPLTWGGLGQAPLGGKTEDGSGRLNNPRGAAAEDSGAECNPFASTARAEEARDNLADTLVPAATAMFGGTVASLWDQYLHGGSSFQELTDSSIVTAFAVSGTSLDAGARAADFVQAELDRKPALPDGVHRLDQIVSPTRRQAVENVMDFDVPGTIPGNIAGGIGVNQASVRVGAQPSPFNDSRTLLGTAEISTDPDGKRSVLVRPRFVVMDTIDLCPGNMGSPFERFLTVPMSRCEASGVSGDVPFRVEFPTPEQVRAVPPAPKPDPSDATVPETTG